MRWNVGLMNIMANPEGESLSDRLTTMLTVAFVVVYVIVGAIVYNVVGTQLVSGVEKETMLRAELAGEEIQNYFENARIVTEQMAANRTFKHYLSTTHTRGDVRGNPLYKETLSTLADIKNLDKNHYLVSVANEEANFYLDNNGTVPDRNFNIKARPWYTIVQGAEGVTFSKPYFEWSTQKLVLSSVEAVELEGRKVGFVIIDIMVDTIPDILKKVHIGTGGKDFLINETGLYIYHPEREMIGKYSIYHAGNAIRPYADEIMKNQKGFVEINLEGKPYYLAHYPATRNGWIMYSLIDKTLLLQDVFVFSMALVCLLLLPLIPMTYYFKRTVAKLLMPIEAIATYSEALVEERAIDTLPEDYLDRTDEMGKLARSLKVITGFYEDKHDFLEAHIAAKNKELEHQYEYILEKEKMASLGSLVAGVAHEINTPLGISLSTASLLEKSNYGYRKKLSEGKMTKEDLQRMMTELDEGVEILNYNLERAADLVKSFKKVAVSQSVSIRHPYALRECIEAVKSSLRHELKAKDIHLDNRCPDDIVVTGDQGDMAQILTNLILNSIQHGFNGKTTGNILIKASETKGSVMLVYEDDGVGMDDEQRKRIFEPFFTTNRSEGNSGLGMHIVYNLISQRIKGTINCVPSDAAGVRFLVRLPLDDV